MDQTAAQQPKIGFRQAVFPRKLVGLYLISFVSGFSMGIFNPLISLVMKAAGIETTLIGWNSTWYYLAVALGAPLAGKLIRSFGIRKVITAGLILTGLCTPLFPLTDNLILWFVIRGLMGLGVSFYMIGGQTGLNEFADERMRGTTTALHAGMFGLGFAVSPLIGTQIYAHFPKLAFLVGGCMVLSGIFAVLLCLPDSKHVEAAAPAQKGLFRRISIPLHAVFLYGAIEGILVSIYPVYLVDLGFSEQETGLALTLFIVGSALGMLPVSWLGDRLGKLRVLFCSSILGAATLILLVMFPDRMVVFLSTGIIGLTIGTFFPLTLALLGELVRSHELAPASAQFTAAFSYGCAAGPVISTYTMKQWGDQHIFLLVTVLLGLLILRSLVSLFRPSPAASLSTSQARPTSD